MPTVTMTVNGAQRSADIAPTVLLSDLLRETFSLKGTHVGCDTSQCGTCVVHVDGRSVKSCAMLAIEADGADIMTIEGIAQPDGTLHPIQQAFRTHHGLQCGFCTPGMVMTAVALLKSNPNPTDAEVRHGLEGNLCRCTGYQNIVDAILAAAKTMGAKA
jgi:aerobic carbon-monoxide dehydrogenase small subunit